MKIVRFDDGKWGILEGEAIHETDSPGGNPTGYEYDLGSVRLRAPANPRTIVCVGRNYLDHIKEMGHQISNDSNLPKEPGLFLKGFNTLADPANPARPETSGDVIPYPDFTSNLHYEGELALVIGYRTHKVSEAEALDHVLGYTCALDVTARDAQKSDLQWVRAKSSDKFCPLGPWLKTSFDPGDTVLRTYVNGELRQEAHTSLMIFSVPRIISYISQFMTLEPGDLVLTGTPQGVGELNRGDQIEVAIEGIGDLHTHVGR